MKVFVVVQHNCISSIKVYSDRQKAVEAYDELIKKVKERPRQRKEILDRDPHLDNNGGFWFGVSTTEYVALDEKELN